MALAKIFDPTLDPNPHPQADAESVIGLKPSWPKGYTRKAAALQSLKRLDEALALPPHPTLPPSCSAWPDGPGLPHPTLVGSGVQLLSVGPHLTSVGSRLMSVGSSQRQSALD